MSRPDQFSMQFSNFIFECCILGGTVVKYIYIIITNVLIIIEILFSCGPFEYPPPPLRRNSPPLIFHPSYLPSKDFNCVDINLLMIF